MNVKSPLKPYLNWRDFAELFNCGRSKALLLMQEVGVIHIGRSTFVKASALEEFLDENGAIDAKWPSRTQRRTGR